MKPVRDLLLVVALGGLMQAIHGYAPGEGVELVGSSVTAALGFVLLTSWLAGRLFASFGLPKLTGYLVAGILVGPNALGLLGPVVLEELKLVNGIAISLIALTAGSELDLRALRPLMRSILAMTFLAVVGGAVVVGVAAYALHGTIPFLHDLSEPGRIAVAATLGIVIVAGSPAVVVAIRKETGADGPVARTTLGVVVVADLVVIVLYAIASTVASAVLDGHADVGGAAGSVAWEVLGSPLIGFVVGAVLSLFVKKVKAGTDYFVVAVCVAIADVSARVHLDPLLVALAAGVFVENVTHQGHELVLGYDKASLPVYVLFFTVAGATVHLDELALVAIPALTLVGVRAAVLLLGSRVATGLVGAEPTVKRYAGFGLLPQAGLAIALALTLSRSFPAFGSAATALVLSIVGVNELVSPVLYRWALVKSGEVVEDDPSETSSDDLAKEAAAGA